MTRENVPQGRLIRIIGIGNEYRNDDGIGLQVARRLKRLRLPDVTALELPDPAAGLLEALSDTDTSIIVDAVSSGAIPGTVSRIDLRSHIIPTRIFRNSTHGISISEIIQLAKILGKLPEHCLVFGIEGKEFGMGKAISAPCAKAIDAVVNMIVEEIDSLVACPIQND